MAIAEPVLRQYGLSKLRQLRIRGPGVLGIAVGAGIAIGDYLGRHYEIGFPGKGKFQPDRTYRGVPYLDETPSNGTANKYKQAYGTSYGRNRYKRNYTKHNRSRQCCCTKCC